MYRTSNLIISVESRKGGVGKTTAALCLARLLRKRDYSVLVLDLDVTGTNAADIAKSPFWESDLHVIKEMVNGIAKNNYTLPPINLLTLFDQFFMNGKAIPAFSTQNTTKEDMLVDLTKVNVLGSQIYKVDKDDNKSRGATCIEQPGILFDDLHTLWLLEFVTKITNNFVRIASNNQEPAKTAIILDNSPGYVGISPAIHEWLTDRGPECGKFLTVMSLDAQDLRACALAIDSLHALYKDKWQTSRLFIDANKDGDGINIDKAQEAFFMRLAALGKGNSEVDDPLAFYRNINVTNLQQQDENGQRFCKHPNEYMAAVINRVPRAIKAGRLVYDFPMSLNAERGALGQLLGTSDTKTEWRERMISYDEYIENQFLLHWLQRRRGHSKRRVHHLIDALAMAERELSEANHEDGDALTRLCEMDYEHYERLRTQLMKTNEIVSRARLAVDDAGLGHMARLIHDEWLPGSIVPNFRSALSRLLSESDLPYFEMMPSEFDRDSMNPEVREFVTHLKKQIIMELRHSPMREKGMADHKTKEVLAGVLSGIVGLSLTSALLRSPLTKELLELFSSVLAIELWHWSKSGEGRSGNLSIQRFLAQESVTRVELDKNMEMFSHNRFSYRMMEGRDSFADFYKACTTAQARLIDFVEDSRFLLHLLRFIVEGEVKNGALFPFVKGIAESVIVHKTMNHDVVPHKMAKALQTAEYFREFDGVLRKVLVDWGVTRE